MIGFIPTTPEHSIWTETLNEQELINRVLQETKVMAIVGLSDKPHRASYQVAEYMMNRGFSIVPVNPRCSEILGQKSYARLEDIPVAVDMVDCFRRSEEMPGLAHSAVSIRAKSLWMQLDIINHNAKNIAEQGGLSVVMDRCPKIEYARLIQKG